MKLANERGLKMKASFPLCAAVAAAVVCTHGAWAEEWQMRPEGGTVTIDADTVVEVNTEAAATNALRQAKIIFENENSEIVFHTSSYPENATTEFQGPGRATFAERIILPGNMTIRRSLGPGGENTFVRFAFLNGIQGNDESTKRNINFSPGCFTNASVRFCGKIATNVVFSSERNGRFEHGEGTELKASMVIAYGAEMMGVVRQTGGTISVEPSSDNSFSGGKGGQRTSYGAFLQDGGYFEGPSNNGIYMYGRYFHLRQRGGDFIVRNRLACSVYDDAAIRTDVVFGGSGIVKINEKWLIYDRDVLFAFMDSVDFSHLYNNWGKGIGHVRGSTAQRIWAFNGGVAAFHFYNTANGETASLTNGVFAFNGGAYAFRKVPSVPYIDDKRVFGYNPSVLVYENGGEYTIQDGKYVSFTTDVEFREPRGSVIKSIRVSDELASKVWQTPPAVEIIDATGVNAAAVVDYDFDTGRVTNITVACKGEGYSDGATANLRYKKGDALLSEPLVCDVGPEQGGDFTFSTTGLTSTIYMYATNWCHGALVVDMNRNMLDDSTRGIDGDVSGACLYIAGSSRFMNAGSIVMKSGLLHSANIISLNTLCPAATNLELYAGYLGGCQYNTFNTITIGGRIGLYGRIEDAYSRLIVDDTLYVDPSCLTNGIVPALTRHEPKSNNSQYAGFVFNPGAKIELKNWDVLPRGKKMLVLDLSIRTNMYDSAYGGTPVLVPSDEGVLSWDDEEQKLYARRHADGMMLIFR